ncbi:MAG: tetratricopeptide repeat protein [Oscillospiraceae bacterium]|nr:tetratricopeptide repeat protein [Oscillospiraceae bacterium]
MKKLLSLILILTLTLTLFASCDKVEEALTATELLDLGEKYLLDLDYEQAIVYFNKVIEVEPKNKSAYLGLAEAYSALGDTEAAVEVLTTALEIFSDDTSTTLEVYEKLAEVDSSNYVWYTEPAQMYLSQGDTESAVSLLQKGLENAESTEEIEELLETVAEESEEDSESIEDDEDSTIIEEQDSDNVETDSEEREAAEEATEDESIDNSGMEEEENALHICIHRQRLFILMMEAIWSMSMMTVEIY